MYLACREISAIFTELLPASGRGVTFKIGITAPGSSG
jgi:hypothetical protein